MTAAAPAPAPPRLLRFKLDQLLPGMPAMSSQVVSCDACEARLVGWSIAIRGAAAFFISPPGWIIGSHPNTLTGKGKVQVFGPVPLTHMTCVWEGDDATVLDRLQRVDVPPMKMRPVAVEATVDSKEMGDA